MRRLAPLHAPERIPVPISEAIQPECRIGTQSGLRPQVSTRRIAGSHALDPGRSRVPGRARNRVRRDHIQWPTGSRKRIGYRKQSRRRARGPRSRRSSPGSQNRAPNNPRSSPPRDPSSDPIRRVPSHLLEASFRSPFLFFYFRALCSSESGAGLHEEACPPSCARKNPGPDIRGNPA